MKKILFLLITILVIACQTEAQVSYSNISPYKRMIIFSDDFDNNNSNWQIKDDKTDLQFINGACYLTSKDANFGKSIYKNISIDPTKNFEIETTFKISPAKNSLSNYFFWGSTYSTNRYRYYINFDGDGYGEIGYYGGKYVTLSKIPSVKSNTVYKITIRKIDNTCYYFINESLIKTQVYEPLYGNEMGYYTSDGGTVSTDYLKVSYLTTGSVVQDNTPPEIVVYEPIVSRGFSVQTANKQLYIKGKASDNNGIGEVKINGIPVTFNSYGEFQYTLKLPGNENTVTIKATDKNNNTATYTFNTQNTESVNVNTQVKQTTNEKRIALVIGNSNYSGGAKLKNPANDAHLIASTLQNLGFEVIKRIDADKKTIEQSVREFSKKLPQYNVALFYFAGHGIQTDGLNYIIPVDAVLKDKTDCKYEAVAVNFVVEEFEKYPENINIVILDACRNDPFRSWSRGGEQGFKAINPTSGTIISFATSEGSTASDGTGSNGLFTQELVKQMVIPQPIEGVFKKTRVQVQKLSGGLQSPQEWSQLTGDFYFKK